MDLVTNRRGLEYRIQWILLHTEEDYNIRFNGSCLTRINFEKSNFDSNPFFTSKTKLTYSDMIHTIRPRTSIFLTKYFYWFESCEISRFITILLLQTLKQSCIRYTKIWQVEKTTKREKCRNMNSPIHYTVLASLLEKWPSTKSMKKSYQWKRSHSMKISAA